VSIAPEAGLDAPASWDVRRVVCPPNGWRTPDIGRLWWSGWARSVGGVQRRDRRVCGSTACAETGELVAGEGGRRLDIGALVGVL